MWFLLLALWSFADVVPAPPDSCVPGAQPVSDHSGAYCAPHSCEADAQCEDGARCVPMGQCMVKRMGHHRGGSFKVDEVIGSCSETQPCNGGLCTTAKRCVAVNAPTGTMPTAPGKPPVTDSPTADPVDKPTVDADADGAKSPKAVPPAVPPSVDPAAVPPSVDPERRASADEGQKRCATVAPGSAGLSALFLLLFVVIVRRADAHATG